jgi:drug/metabolite transporter (DMT)-like permease
MKPVIYSILAIICYALANVLVEQKLSKLNALTIMMCYSGVIFTLTCIALLIVRNTNEKVLQIPPIGRLLWVALGVGVVFTLADFFFITAYTSGGKLFLVTSIYVLFPVCASIIKYGMTGEKLNAWQLGGYVLATLAILCITKGSGIEAKTSIPP